MVWKRTYRTAALLGVAGFLIGCNPEPGEGTLSISGADIEVSDVNGSVECTGDPTRPVHEWTGTIDGQPASFRITTPEWDEEHQAASSDTYLTIGEQSWVGDIAEPHIPPYENDGTRHVEDILVGPSIISVEASLRCPHWVQIEVDDGGQFPDRRAGVCDVFDVEDGWYTIGDGGSILFAGDLSEVLIYKGMIGPWIGAWRGTPTEQEGDAAVLHFEEVYFDEAFWEWVPTGETAEGAIIANCPPTDD